MDQNKAGSASPGDDHLDTVPLRTKLAFGVGATAEQVCLRSFGLFALLYYNQVLGLPATLAGAALTIALLFDAINDPLIGSLSDRFRSKRFGRRHPFLFVAPLPVAICYFFVFNPPEGLGGTGLFVYFTVMSILLRSFMTLFFVPHLAMGGELSKNYTERSKIMSYNNFGGYIGGAGIYWIALTYFFAATPDTPNGMLARPGYEQMGLFAGVFTLVVLYACAWFTRDRIPTLTQPRERAAPFSFGAFFRDLQRAFTNRNYVYLLLGFFLLSVMLGTREGFNNYMNLFYWELVPAQMRFYVVGLTIAYAAAFFLTFQLHRRFDKRPIIVVSALGLSVLPALPVMLRLVGWFPENGAPALFPLLVVFSALGSACGAVLNISVMSALADIADENELKHGNRQEGILYSARTFFAKADHALGLFLAGIVLDMIAFPRNAQPGEVAPGVLHLLGLVDSPYTILPGVLAAALYAGYRINKARHREIQQGLERVRAASSG